MKTKTFKCREQADGCEGRYKPWTSHLQRQAVCQNPSCLLQKAEKNRKKLEARKAKADRGKTRAEKERLKTRGTLLKEAQVEFNRYIRERDKGKGCICCDKPLINQSVGGGYDSGHYRSVGSSPHLRFNEKNAHGQTKYCNRYLSGSVTNYRIGLVGRIGVSAVDALECDNESRRWSREDLVEIKLFYRSEWKSLASQFC